MPIDVKVPTLGESITEAIVLEWLVAVGDVVTVDQDLVVLETDKITVNVPAPAGGAVVSLAAKVDAEVSVGAVIAVIDETKAGHASRPKPPATPSREPAPAAGGSSAPRPEPRAADVIPLMPAVRRLVEEHDLDPAVIAGTGKGGRVLKEDVLRFLEARDQAGKAAKAQARDKEAQAIVPSLPPPRPAESNDRREEVVAMSSLRRRIAERLVAAQQQTASLTTFNEVDMSAVMALRARYKQEFQDKHGVKLGFMGFFAKAAIEALKAYPGVNAEIRGDSIVYKNFYDIGVAVGGGRGLVVPVIRGADRLSFAGFEAALAELADKAQTNRLSLEEMTGGTFTLSNGGIYGSLLSTPILNPPQAGILGLHKIEQRAVAVDGQVVVRPMMYVALTYDHRVVDGREAVSFLVRLKECIEDPSRVLLEV